MLEKALLERLPETVAARAPGDDRGARSGGVAGAREGGGDRPPDEAEAEQRDAPRVGGGEATAPAARSGPAILTGRAVRGRPLVRPARVGPPRPAGGAVGSSIPSAAADPALRDALFPALRRRSGLARCVHSLVCPAAFDVATLGVQVRAAARTAPLLREERLDRRDGVDLTAARPAGEAGHAVILAPVRSPRPGAWAGRAGQTIGSAPSARATRSAGYSWSSSPPARYFS